MTGANRLIGLTETAFSAEKTVEHVMTLSTVKLNVGSLESEGKKMAHCTILEEPVGVGAVSAKVGVVTAGGRRGIMEKYTKVSLDVMWGTESYRLSVLYCRTSVLECKNAEAGSDGNPSAAGEWTNLIGKKKS